MIQSNNPRPIWVLLLRNNNEVSCIVSQVFLFVGQPAFSSVIGKMRGGESFGIAMPTRRKRQKQGPEWRFTLEQIGQGLRDVYPAPENLPPELSTVVTLHRQME